MRLHVTPTLSQCVRTLLGSGAVSLVPLGVLHEPTDVEESFKPCDGDLMVGVRVAATDEIVPLVERPDAALHPGFTPDTEDLRREVAEHAITRAMGVPESR